MKFTDASQYSDRYYLSRFGRNSDTDIPYSIFSRATEPGEAGAAQAAAATSGYTGPGQGALPITKASNEGL